MLHLRIWVQAIVLAFIIVGLSYFLPATWHVPTLLLVPGVWVALLVRTPNVHGGAGFLRVAILISFLIYSILIGVAGELTHAIRRRNR